MLEQPPTKNRIWEVYYTKNARGTQNLWIVYKKHTDKTNAKLNGGAGKIGYASRRCCCLCVILDLIYFARQIFNEVSVLLISSLFRQWPCTNTSTKINANNSEWRNTVTVIIYVNLRATKRINTFTIISSFFTVLIIHGWRCS